MLLQHGAVCQHGLHVPFGAGRRVLQRAASAAAPPCQPRLPATPGRHVSVTVAVTVTAPENNA